jgi:hypothetical protein
MTCRACEFQSHASDMNKTVWIILAVVGVLLVFSCLACGVGVVFFVVPGLRNAADRQVRLNDLKEVALAVHACMDDKKRGPANADELATYLRAQVVERVRKGEIEVVWNAARQMEQKEGTSNVLIAWDTRTDGGQRLVVFLDGFTRIMQEAEFASKPKARTTSSKN